MLTALGLCIAGLAGLVVGAELVVRGGAALAVRLGITPLVIGLTVVAIGTSTPELAVGIEAALLGNGALAVGNIAGTNTVNILLILGLSALLDPLVLRRQSIHFDLPVMIVSALALVAMTWDGVLTRLDGGIMVAGALLYTAAIVRLSRRESRAVHASFARDIKEEIGVPRVKRDSLALFRDAVTLVGGIIVVVLGADLLVDGAVDLARLWGLSDGFIGLTVVAIGTSSPELVTAVVATVRKERDIAIGNLIGSSVYNVLAILGLAALVPESGIAVGSNLIHIDIPVMAAVAVLCWPVFASGSRISRLEGGCFVAAYFAYLTYLLVART